MDLKEKLMEVTKNLMEAKAALVVAQRRFDEVYLKISNSGANGAITEVSTNGADFVFEPKTKQEKILFTLQKTPEEEFSVPFLAEKVAATENTTRVILYNLKKINKVKQGDKRGTWKAVLSLSDSFPSP